MTKTNPQTKLDREICNLCQDCIEDPCEFEKHNYCKQCKDIKSLIQSREQEMLEFVIGETEILSMKHLEPDHWGSECKKCKKHDIEDNLRKKQRQRAEEWRRDEN